MKNLLFTFLNAKNTNKNEQFFMTQRCLGKKTSSEPIKTD